MNIVLLDRDTLAENINFPPPKLTGCNWREYETTAANQVVERALDAQVIITNKVPLRGELISRLPALQLIAVAATGVDHIDIAAAQQRNIAVCNVSNYAQHSVVEHVFSMLLALRRHTPAYHQAVLRGDWSRSDNFTLHGAPIHELRGSTLGVIGTGNLGQAVAHLADAMGMYVLLAEKRGAQFTRPAHAPFEEVLYNSDVLTLHVPLTPQTRHLIGRAELASMKPNAILINTARGGVVDEAALADALRAGHIGGACIDVLNEEPPPPDHPLLAADLPNLLITPHIAWASIEAQQRLAAEVVANIEAYFSGKQRNRIV